MRKFLTVLCVIPFAHAQDFSTTGGDTQRSSWVRGDAKISRASMQKPGFSLLWKVKTPSNSLTPASLLSLYIGYRGFRALGFVGGGTDKVFAFDTDLGRIEWQKTLNATPSPCGMTASVARAAITAIPGTPGGRGFGGGRGNFAKSAVGEPGEGAVTVKDAATRNAAIAAAMAAPPPSSPGRGAGPSLPSVYAPHREYAYAISSDGMLHSMVVSNGEEPDPAVPFLPANANATGLIVIGNVAYAATTAGCGNVPAGIWALDIASKQVASWKGSVVGAEDPAFGPDGTLYVATDAGELIALEAKTLKLNDVYKAGAAFTSSPVIFQHKDGPMIAVAARDGRIHVVNSTKLAAAATVIETSAAVESLASWQDVAGTRYLLASTPSAVEAYKLPAGDGGVKFEKAWSQAMQAPVAPYVMNGVVFAAAAGSKASPTVLHALDGGTGNLLWDSGKTITSFLKGGGISGSGGQVYLGTQDGIFYAFGFPMEH